MVITSVITTAKASQNVLLAKTHLEAGIAKELPIDAKVGDYVVVSMNSEKGIYDLSLLDQKGHHVRRLASQATGERVFRFVAEEGVRFKLSVLTAGDFRLSMEKKFPAHEIGQQVRNETQVLISPALKKLAGDLSEGGSTETFWRDIKNSGTPLFEDGDDGQKIMTFLVRGAHNNARIFGAPTGEHEAMERLGVSDVWFKSFMVPADTRLSYQIAVDVPVIPGTTREKRVAILATAKADPFNLHPTPADAPDAFNQDSVFETESSPQQHFIKRQSNPKGTLENFDFESARLGNRRRVTIYRPANFDASRDDTILLFVFDGAEYQTKVPTPLILDNMIAEKLIPQVVAVFVANPDSNTRAKELPGNSDFADFMAEDLLTEVLRRTQIKHRAERTVLAGSSYGGLASMTVALAHPNIFGNVLSMSGSFWWSPEGTPRDRNEYVAYQTANAKRLPLRVYISAGLFETGHSGGTMSILDTNRHLRDVLQAKGVPTSYQEYSGGHDYIIWRGALSDGLISLFQ